MIKYQRYLVLSIAYLVGLVIISHSHVAVAASTTFSAGINLQGSTIDFNKGGSKIYDNVHLRIETDDKLFLKAPDQVNVSDDLQVGDTIIIANNKSRTDTGSAIYDDNDLYIKTDDNLHIIAPGTTYFSGNINSKGLTVSSGVVSLPQNSITSYMIHDDTINSDDIAEGSIGGNDLASNVNLVTSGYVTTAALNVTGISSFSDALITPSGTTLKMQPATGGGIVSTVARNGATGTEVAFDYIANINKAAGNYTGIKLNVTEVSAPGTNYLLDLEVASTSKYTVSNSGAVTQAGGLTVSSGGASVTGGVTVSTGGLTVSTGGAAITGNSSVAGNLTIGSGGHIKSTQTTPPTIGTPSSCGTSPSSTMGTGATDATGSLTITAGTGSPGTCTVTITYNAAYGSAPKAIILTPASSTGPAKSAYVSANNSGSFNVTLGTAPSASEANTFYYLIVE